MRRVRNAVFSAVSGSPDLPRCVSSRAGAACAEREIPPLVRAQPRTTQGERRGAQGRWFITPHAVRQYITRIVPGLSYGRALSELIQMSIGSHFVRQQRNGELWRGPKPRRLRFIVCHDAPGKPQLVTVLFAFDREP